MTVADRAGHPGRHPHGTRGGAGCPAAVAAQGLRGVAHRDGRAVTIWKSAGSCRRRCGATDTSPSQPTASPTGRSSRDSMSFSPLSGCRGRSRSGMERVGETDQYFRVDVAGLPAGRPPAVALAASGYPALVEANLPRLVGAFVTPAVTWPSSAADAWGRRGRCLCCRLRG